ncbi:MAG: response regulator [Legionellaceae bacterium]|nr:response regulator [Legionellaceae bacterium]
MTQNTEKGISESEVAIHQYYMDIINGMPNIVYWVDLDCALKGSNTNFVKLLGLKDLHDFTGTAYELLIKYAHWPESRVEAVKLDDMTAIFSGKANYKNKDLPITIGDKQLSYLSTRVPLFDNKKQVCGLVVILEDITDHMTNERRTLEDAHPDFMLIERPSGRPPRILMVEDNPIAQKVEQALMVTLGCEVDMAESGEQALDLFVPGKYDVVFMDIGLQDTSGYIVAKKLRAKEKGTDHHVPIIALTSYQAEIVKYDCRDYFMDGVITKPLSSDQAQQIIEHYVYHKDVLVSGLESV